jgi:N-carbamoyl-L-amino-acid hydrolase
MRMRRDPVVAAAAAISRVTALAVAEGATATVGQIVARPGVVTIVAAEVELSVDLRHPDPDVLEKVLAGARRIFAEAAAASGVAVTWESQWRIAPVPFDPDLIELGRSACADAGVAPFTMTSGALHDAAAMAPRLPTVMLFVPSMRGISHSAAEHTDPSDLAVGVRALDALLERTLGWAATRPAVRSCGQ